MESKVNIDSGFDKIYITYYPRMIRFAKEYLISEEDAENIVQDIFLLLWEKRRVLNINISLAAYLFSLVKYRCLNYLRHQMVTITVKEELSVFS